MNQPPLFLRQVSWVSCRGGIQWTKTNHLISFPPPWFAHGHVAEFESMRHEEMFARIWGKGRLHSSLIKMVSDAEFQTVPVILLL